MVDWKELSMAFAFQKLSCLTFARGYALNDPKLGHQGSNFDRCA